MPKYLVKYSMVAYWQTEIEAEDVESACWVHSDELVDLADEPMEWDDFSIDSVVDLATGEEHEIVTTYESVELPNRYKGKKDDDVDK